MTHTSALILAGGTGRRMGVDKLRLSVGPGAKSILQHVVEVALTVADDAVLLLAASRGGTDAIDSGRSLFTGSVASDGRIRTCLDTRPDAGPLAALATAWPEAAHSDLVFVLAGDLPGLQPEVLRACARQWAEGTVSDPALDGALVARDGRLQPLLGCYRQAAGRAWMEAARAGESRVMAVAASLTLATVAADLWPPWWTRPVHTPDDYAAWRRFRA